MVEKYRKILEAGDFTIDQGVDVINCAINKLYLIKKVENIWVMYSCFKVFSKKYLENAF